MARSLEATAALIAVLVAAVSVLGFASPALAQDAESNSPALTLVQEAIAIIRSQPELTGEAAGKITDALASSDSRGVDLSQVRRAQSALEAGDLGETELLLERAVGACPGQAVATPAGIRTPPLSSPCPAPSHLKTLDRKPVGGAARPILLGLAGLAVLGGLVLARRVR